MAEQMAGTDESPIAPYERLSRLDGLGMVVIGAGQGIGRQAAHACRTAGADVVCVDVDAERAHLVAEQVSGVPVVADVTESAGAGQVAKVAAAELGRPWGVIDVVGQARWASLVDITDEDFEWALSMNARHAFFLAREFGRLLGKLGGGSLVFVGSISGTSSAPSHAAYGMAKAGLLSLVRTAAVELGPAGVRVNAVSPGTTATPRFLSSGGNAVDRAGIEPLGKVGTPADIAGAALFLSSPLAGHITGQNLIVDGGVTCKFPVPTR